MRTVKKKKENAISATRNQASNGPRISGDMPSLLLAFDNRYKTASCCCQVTEAIKSAVVRSQKVITAVYVWKEC